MNAANKEPSQEDKVRVIAFFIFIIVVLIFWIRSCGNEETQQEPQEPTIPLTLEEQRKADIEHCFDPWDGSHIELTRLVKESMGDPDSYNHVETTYSDLDSVLLVETTFRGRNGFGGMVKQTVLAITGSKNCFVIEIID